MQFSASDAASLERILKWRRDVRHFRATPISEATLAHLQATMDYAPSVGNARPWRVLRVEDAALRRGIRANFIEANATAAASYADEQREKYLALKLAGLDAAPIQLAVFTRTDPEEGHKLGWHTMDETLRQSTAMAIHTLWLAARTENLGLGMVSILDPRAVEQLFGVPHDWEFSAYLCLGYPEFSDDTPLLHREGWQENTLTSWDIR